jgi:predicted DNA-binding transcriptional regulator AlpA
VSKLEDEISELIRGIVREELQRIMPQLVPANELEWIDTKEVSKRTGLSVKTLKHYRLDGEGPPFSKIGRRVVYQVADVENWMNSKKRGVR